MVTKVDKKLQLLQADRSSAAINAQVPHNRTKNRIWKDL